MAEKAPLKLTLYEPETGEVKAEITQVFIPTGIFGELAQMIKAIDLDHPEDLEPEVIESLYALVCELFGNRITIDQIKKGTDLGEFATLLTNIMARVGAVMPGAEPNPTQPVASTRKRHKQTS
jgi:hypothetical protein